MIALPAWLTGSRIVIGLAIIAVLVFGIMFLRWDAYRDGVRATDARWEAAAAKLERDALESAGKASSKADARAAEYVAKVDDEKEKIDAALDAGDSAFDAMFGVRP